MGGMVRSDSAERVDTSAPSWSKWSSLNEHAAGIQVSRQGANVRSRIEYRLLLLGYLVGQLAAVALQVQPLVALQPCGEAGLGQEGNPVFVEHTHTRSMNTVPGGP